MPKISKLYPYYIHYKVTGLPSLEKKLYQKSRIDTQFCSETGPTMCHKNNFNLTIWSRKLKFWINLIIGQRTLFLTRFEDAVRGPSSHLTWNDPSVSCRLTASVSQVFRFVFISVLISNSLLFLIML